MAMTNLPMAVDSVALRPPTLLGPPLPQLPSAGDQGPRAPGGMALSDILTAVRRRYRLVLGVVLLTSAAAGLFALQEMPTFTATVVVRIGDARRMLTTGMEAPDAPTDRMASPVLSQIQLLRSRTLAGAVVDSAGLRLVPDFSDFRPTFLRDVRVAKDAPSDTLRLWFGAHAVAARFDGQTVGAPYGEPLRLRGIVLVVSERPETPTSVWTVVPREEAIDGLLGKLRVKPRTQTNVVDIAYAARRPSVAQRVVNTVATLYQLMDARSAQEQSRRRRVFLEAQISQTDTALTRAQLALTEFRRHVRVYSTSAKLQGEQRDLALLDTRVEEFQAQRSLYASLLAALQSPQVGRREEGLRTLLASPGVRNNLAVAQLYERLTQLRGTHDSLSTGVWRRSESDPDVARLRALITATESQLVSTVRGELSWVESSMRNLGGSRTRNELSLDSLSGLEAEEMRLGQQVDALRKSGDQLRADYQRARMAEEVEVGPVEIVDLAGLPYVPDAMLRMLKLFLGVVLGVALGGALAVILEMRDTSIRSVEDLERVLQVPALATIPRQPDPVGTATSRYGRPKVGGWPMMRDAKATGRGRRLRPDALVMLTRSSTQSIEAYRVLRTTLLFSRSGQLPRSLVVTSAAPSEGKSVTAANLAITCAQSGMRVLLADCDLRRGQQHHLFGVARSPGIAQLLGGTASSDDAIRPTHVAGLDLLTAGVDELGATDTLRSTRMLSIIRALREKYDLLILDAPPVLAVADASILSALADGVLLVLRAGHTDRREALAAVQQLDTVGARVLGAVLNDAPATSYGYPYVHGATRPPAVATT